MQNRIGLNVEQPFQKIMRRAACKQKSAVSMRARDPSAFDFCCSILLSFRWCLRLLQSSRQTFLCLIRSTNCRDVFELFAAILWNRGISVTTKRITFLTMWDRAFRGLYLCLFPGCFHNIPAVFGCFSHDFDQSTSRNRQDSLQLSVDHGAWSTKVNEIPEFSLLLYLRQGALWKT